MVIISDRDLVNRQEGRILIDGDDIRPSAGLRRVAGAGVVATLLWELLAADGVAAVAYAVVLQSGVPEPVALADRDTFLDGHVLLVELAAQTQGFGRVGVGVAAGVDEGLEGVQAGWEFDGCCPDTGDEGEDSQGCRSKGERTHGDG